MFPILGFVLAKEMHVHSILSVSSYLLIDDVLVVAKANGNPMLINELKVQIQYNSPIKLFLPTV